MGVQEINGNASFDAALRVPNLVVVDFFATWCGPCVQIAPFVEELSNKYPDVVFLKVNADENKDIMSRSNVKAFPTFHFYINGAKVDEMRGANPQKLEDKVTTLKAGAGKSSFANSSGHTLGAGSSASSPPVAWDGVGDPPIPNARAARLKAFGHLDAKQKESIYKDRAGSSSSSSSSSVGSSSSSAATSQTTAQEDEDEAIAKAIALSMAPEGTQMDTESTPDTTDTNTTENEKQKEKEGGGDKDADADWDGEQMVPVPVDESLLAQLVSMEFSDVRARKGIVHGKTMEGALSWLEENHDSPDIDQPYMVKKKDTVPKKPLTQEEKAAKLLELKEKAARRKREREEQEKAEELQREKERRVRGQRDGTTDEERERLARKREAARKKKEKDDVAKERLRLRAEIARDKELRKANKGVLPSVLGVDGYNPSAVQYDQTVETAPSSSSSSSSTSTAPPATTAAPTAAPTTVAPKKVKPASSSSSASNSSSAPPADPVKVIDSAITTISRYRTGGDGGAALKLLLLLLRNVHTHPDESKYRSVNLEGKAYKSKLGHLVGPLALLKAVGFRPNEDGDKLVLPDGEGALVAATMEKLVQAEALFVQMNS